MARLCKVNSNTPWAFQWCLRRFSEGRWEGEGNDLIVGLGVRRLRLSNDQNKFIPLNIRFKQSSTETKSVK